MPNKELPIINISRKTLTINQKISFDIGKYNLRSVYTDIFIFSSSRYLYFLINLFFFTNIKITLLL